ncbi:MAG: DegT/DnrJ/EryC1/StrS family aminotransferase [Bacteroidota bacterium]
MSYRIPLSYNCIDHHKVYRVLEEYAGKNHFELLSDFEESLQRLTGARYAAALSSGTAAIHLALKALDVGPGDLVLASTFTYVATINPILYQQAVPVFIDSEPDTWNMDPHLLEVALKSSAQKPKAIIVVHTYGMPAKMDELMAIAHRHNVPVIEDAAEALGSRFHGRHMGTLGDIGILSFNNNKVLTTFGGGAVLTNDENVYRRVLYWSTQAREPKHFNEHTQVGYNYRMGPLNAAAGLASMPLLEEQVNARRAIYQRYKSSLAGLPGIRFMNEPRNYFSNAWLSTILIQPESSGGRTQEMLSKTLHAHGIETRPLWNPMHRQPVFSRFKSFTNGCSETLFDQGICLPSSNHLSASEQAEIVKRISEIYYLKTRLQP